MKWVFGFMINKKSAWIPSTPAIIDLGLLPSRAESMFTL